jgi:hypothetical protein
MECVVKFEAGCPAAKYATTTAARARLQITRRGSQYRIASIFPHRGGFHRRQFTPHAGTINRFSR